jgi:hypothetical protein
MLTVCLAAWKLRKLQEVWSWILHGCKPIRNIDICCHNIQTNYEQKTHAWEIMFSYIKNTLKIIIENCMTMSHIGYMHMM